MLCVGGRSRTTANPHVTTSDLEKIIEEWLVEKGHRDLNTLFKELGMKVTWKTAPQACVLAMYATLFRLFAMVCPNGVIPGQRLNMALGSVHHQLQQDARQGLHRLGLGFDSLHLLEVQRLVQE